jgi:hypothetical protein
MPTTPYETRTVMLTGKLRRTLLNVSGWWGIGLPQALTVLAALQAELSAAQHRGTLQWPDPRLAKYNPGTPDADLRDLAYDGAAALTARGVRPSARNVWRWCKAHGARKREAMALRIVGSVVASLSAREVAATHVCRNNAPT